ncbi:MAG: Lrp/AsnC ligand binding domain-containing protein [Candidatus Bathyarchaeota archaeon]|nr:Lrp/AsnC ligand binding domain-containing protein [Candidatus Bathyarchaeota archaeon]
MRAYMGLVCKPGSYITVLKALLRMFADQRDIFLMFGQIDILIQFNDLKNIEEFKDKWFNPIRMTGSENDLIVKTLTLIALSEGPELIERPFAFVFLNTKPKNLEDIRTTLLAMPAVLSADSVFGPFDLICSVKAEDNTELETLVLAIQQISGIESSMTSIVAAANIMSDY